MAENDAGLGTKQEKKKGEDPEEHGERIYS